MKTGILAMQGAFAEHKSVLDSLGIETVLVRSVADLHRISGLVIPGGESTTMGKMLDRYDMIDPLKKMIDEGFPVFGTCAGLVLLSRHIDAGADRQPLLGHLNVSTLRNGYGRQNESFEAGLEIRNGSQKRLFHGIFIRAPIISGINPPVEVLASYGGNPVAVRQKNILATTFHPELAGDDLFHRYFINMIKEAHWNNG